MYLKNYLSASSRIIGSRSNGHKIPISRHLRSVYCNVHISEEVWAASIVIRHYVQRRSLPYAHCKEYFVSLDDESISLFALSRR
jgi:hypothetical protein